MNTQEGTPNAPEKSGDHADEQPLEAVVQQVFSSLAISRTGPSYHPIFGKFEPEHVAYALMGLGVFVFMTLFLLPGHSSLYIEILKGLGIFAAGAAGGYGLKAYRDSSRA